MKEFPGIWIAYTNKDGGGDQVFIPYVNIQSAKKAIENFNFWPADADPDGAAYLKVFNAGGRVIRQMTFNQ